MEIEFDNETTRKNNQLVFTDEMEKLSPLELFRDFYEQQNNKQMSDKQLKIVEEIFEDIYNKLKNAGMMDIVAPNGDGAVYLETLEQIVSIAYENGTVYSYSANETGNEQFNNLTRILMGYCNFPEINPAWFGAPGTPPPPPPPQAATDSNISTAKTEVRTRLKILAFFIVFTLSFHRTNHGSFFKIFLRNFVILRGSFLS